MSFVIVNDWKNKEEVKRYMRDYQERNKDILRKKEQTYIICPHCASVIQHSYLKKHMSQFDLLHKPSLN